MSVSRQAQRAEDVLSDQRNPLLPAVSLFNDDGCLWQQGSLVCLLVPESQEHVPPWLTLWWATQHVHL